MFKKFISKLKNLYYTPASADQTMTEKEKIMSDLSLDTPQASVSTPAPTLANADAAVSNVAAVTPAAATVSDVTPAVASTSMSSSDVASVAASAGVPSSVVTPAATSTDTSSADEVSNVASSDSDSPLASFKARAQAFVEFVEKGIEVLGQEAEAELVALKAKYF